MKYKVFLTLLPITFLLTGCNFDASFYLHLKDNFQIKDTIKEVEGKTANIVLLYGQSNATGYSFSSCLKENDLSLYNTYLNGYENVFINYNCENFGNYSNEFTKAKLGQGTTTNSFGPEMGIAETLTSIPGDTFIIKYSYGGTALFNEWLNGCGQRGGLYNHSIKFTKQSLDYISLKGYELNILGMCWMQGEADACKIYPSYYRNTANLVSFYREDLKEYSDSIKFIDAYILNSPIWTMHVNINEAKREYNKVGNNCYLVDTIAMGLTTHKEPFDKPDIYHYDSLSMVDLGRAFGNYLKQ